MATSSQYLSRFTASLIIALLIIMFTLVVFAGIDDAYVLVIPTRTSAFSGNTTGRGLHFLILAAMILIYSGYNLVEFFNVTKEPVDRYYHPLKKRYWKD